MVVNGFLEVERLYMKIESLERDRERREQIEGDILRALYRRKKQAELNRLNEQYEAFISERKLEDSPAVQKFLNDIVGKDLY